MTHSVPIDVQRGEAMFEGDDPQSTDGQIQIIRAERDELATAVSELRDAFATIREEMIASQELAAAAQETREQLQQTELTLTECRTDLQEAKATIAALQLDLNNAFGAIASQAVVPEEMPPGESTYEESDHTEQDVNAHDVTERQVTERQVTEPNVPDPAMIEQVVTHPEPADVGTPEQSMSDEATGLETQPAVADYISELFGVTPQTAVPDSDDALPWAESTEESLSDYEERADAGTEDDAVEPAATVEQEATQDSDDVPVASVQEPDPEPAKPSVRSEIAELFGLTSSAFEEKPPAEKRVTAAAELMSAVDDYSQEEAAAVSMSFEEAGRVLLKPDSEPVDQQETAVGDEPEDEHDDFVSQYMEQLLSRNRQSAGASLPEELTRPSSRGGSKAKSKPEPKPRTGGSTSFIDQYMSGAYTNTDQPVADAGGSNTAIPGTSVSAASPPPVPRPKIDVEKMRQTMNSFREVSTRSTENALATHARRQQRGGIAARTTILTGLSLVCLLIMAASLTKVIPFGLLAWLSLTAVAVSAGELVLKLKSIRSQLQMSVVRLQGDLSKGHRDVEEQPVAAGAQDPAPRFATHAVKSESDSQNTGRAEGPRAQPDLVEASGGSEFEH